MFDLTKFSDIVIYVGGNDSSNNSDNEYFEEKYEQLLQHIKSITPTSKIHLCTFCPRGDTDVEKTYDVIKRLCEEHELICIDTNSGFYDKRSIFSILITLLRPETPKWGLWKTVKIQVK